MSLDAQSAGSSPATDTAPATPAAPSSAPAAAEPRAPRSLDSLSPAQLHTWRMSGELPGGDESTDSPSPAESAPAQPGDQAASTDAHTEAASEPAAPKGKEKRQKELDADIQRMLAQRAELRAEIERLSAPQTPTQDVQPGSSPAVSGGDFPDFDSWAALPENAGKVYEHYTREQIRHEIRQEERARHVEHARSQRVEAFKARVQESAKADPEFVKALRPEVVNLPTMDALQPGQAPSSFHFLGQEISMSEHAPQLMRHYSEHPDELAAIGRMTPDAVIRTIGRLEARFAAPTPSAPAVTQAPEPPTTLGSKATLAADDVEGALQRGDFAAYAAAQNKRELAARAQR